MEKVFKLDFNGQQIQQQDFTDIGQYGLIDDRVLAELYRMTPYDGSTVTKGIIPNTTTQTAFIAANGASGSVKVQPFRALVGSRTAVASDAKANWRDIRSAIAVGSTTLHQVVSITANSSGNPRWDLIYAAVAVDANDTSTTRKVKDPTTKVVTSETVATNKVTTVTLGVTAGTAAASPVWPTTPSDSGGTYYIPLGYVRVPNGFNASSTVGTSDIAVTAPCLNVSALAGANSFRVANSHNAISTTLQQSWGSTGTRPTHFVPSTVQGTESLFIQLDLYSGTPSHASGDVVDSSRDWRNRLVRWTAVAAGGIDGGSFATNVGGSAAARVFPAATDHAKYPAPTNGYVWTGLGSTVPDASHAAIYIIGDSASAHYDTISTQIVSIQVDATTGYLKVTYSGTANYSLAIWAEFSAPFA